ncbi:hypothetical protein ANASTE_00723 [Anaerofustis stercorihominis DSM 17244]|uniref:Uncharacterized protein n=1 Tax=Anaerofustis stercorihominis DSM 17244 TaxID=445971 RepID=B1C7M1_9FIRM|nr:hypothetical protein [Anaerofustis stercorihominis]EDS73008.1 hypothetical protein ANASTE_00723 [Anaerofustis stercorihominis DSM 17244]
MAASGRITGKYSNNSDVYISLEWELKSQDKEANKSVIHCELWLRGKDSYRHWNFNSNTKFIIVDGNKKTNTSTSFDTNKNPCKLMQGDFTVKHNSDGSGSFKVSAKHYSGVKLGTATISGKSFNITQIKRISKLNSISISGEYNGIKASYTKYNTKFTDNLVIKCGSFTKTVKGYKSGSLVSFSSSEKESIKKVIGTGKSVTFTCYLQTYSGSTYVGKSNTLSKTGEVTQEVIPKIYIKTGTSSISKIKSIYIKTDTSSIIKVKSVYIKPSGINKV